MAENPLELWRSAEIGRLEDALLRFCPSRQWQIVTVTFPSTPNADLDIAHLLTPSNPELVSYQVLQTGTPCVVWADRSGARTAWSAGVIRLRCTAPSAQVVLLLSVASDSRTLPTTSADDQGQFWVADAGVGYVGSSTYAGGGWLGPGVRLGPISPTVSSSPSWEIGLWNASNPSDQGVIVTERVNGYSPLLIRRYSGDYFVQPFYTSNVTQNVSLGNPNDSAFQGWWDDCYVRNGYFERSRTTRLGEWAAYTPTWTAVTTNPTLGNGTLTGRYTLVGKTAHFELFLQIGGTTTFGTGDWRFSLPQTAAATALGTFQGYARDNSAGTRLLVSTGLVTTTTIALFADGSTANFEPAVPFTWAQDDTLRVVGTFEIA